MVKLFECVVIGQGTLPLACSEILHARGNKICAIISEDAAFLCWAAARQIPYAASLADLPRLISGQSRDILFSIGNARLIPGVMLDLFGSAINYHDGPLPRYAGSHVTSWAIMSQEKSYAVTWHLMTRHTDAGDILRQVPVEISTEDSALTLNAKCYEAAMSGFDLLIEELENAKVQPYAQDLSRRTFFHRNRRPANGGVLDWNSGCDDLSALVRALNFGSYPNPLGISKVLIGEELLALGALDVIGTRSIRPPGTIVTIEPDKLVVATVSSDVSLRDVKSLDGRSLSIGELVARHSLQVGDRLPTIDQSEAVRLTQVTETLFAHEHFWISRLVDIRPLGLPYLAPVSSEREMAGNRSCVIPTELIHLLQVQADHPAETLLYVFLAYLARINGQPTFDIGIRDDGVQSEFNDLRDVFAAAVPIHIDLNFSKSFACFSSTTRAELALIRSHRTYPLDAFVRNPELKATGKARSTKPWLIAAHLAAPQPSGHLSANHMREGLRPESQPLSQFTFHISAQGESFTWIDTTGVMDRKQIERMSDHFLVFLKSCLISPNLPLRALPLLSKEELQKLQIEEGANGCERMQAPC
jgi:methionyl-tRNA formyltransferase